MKLSGTFPFQKISVKHDSCVNQKATNTNQSLYKWDLLVYIATVIGISRSSFDELQVCIKSISRIQKSQKLSMILKGYYDDGVFK